MGKGALNKVNILNSDFVFNFFGQAQYIQFSHLFHSAVNGSGVWPEHEQFYSGKHIMNSMMNQNNESI